MVVPAEESKNFCFFFFDAERRELMKAFECNRRLAGPGWEIHFWNDGVVVGTMVNEHEPFRAVGGNGFTACEPRSKTPATDLTTGMTGPCLCAKDIETGVMYSMNCLDGYFYPWKKRPRVRL